jgi:hypothetical protein
MGIVILRIYPDPDPDMLKLLMFGIMSTVTIYTEFIDVPFLSSLDLVSGIL